MLRRNRLRKFDPTFAFDPGCIRLRAATHLPQPFLISAALKLNHVPRDASTVITSVAAGAAILMGNDEEAPPPSRQGQGPRERRERTPSYLTKWYKMIMSDGFRDPTSAVGRGRALPSGDCLRPRGYIWTTGIRRWFGADGPCGRSRRRAARIRQRHDWGSTSSASRPQQIASSRPGVVYERFRMLCDLGGCQMWLGDRENQLPTTLSAEVEPRQNLQTKDIVVAV